MKILIRISAVMSSACCLFAGIWILRGADFKAQGDTLGIGIGLYFVGKAFFVGPMLLVAAEKICPKAEVK